MHLPDGLLPPREWLPLAVVAGGVVVFASVRAGRTMDMRRVPTARFLAATALVLQMVNFPPSVAPAPT